MSARRSSGSTNRPPVPQQPHLERVEAEQPTDRVRRAGARPSPFEADLDRPIVVSSSAGRGPCASRFWGPGLQSALSESIVAGDRPRRRADAVAASRNWVAIARTPSRGAPPAPCTSDHQRTACSHASSTEPADPAMLVHPDCARRRCRRCARLRRSRAPPAPCVPPRTTASAFTQVHGPPRNRPRPGRHTGTPRR